MRMVPLLLVLLLPPQDGVDALIRQLGDDQIDARERASDQLIRMGEPARDALVKASTSTDPEVRARAASILKTLDLHKELRLWLGPPPRVSLEGETSLEEAVRAFERQTGQRVACDSWPEGRFKIRLKDAPIWEALESICKASGARTFAFTAEGPRLAGRRYVEVSSTLGPQWCVRCDSVQVRRQYQVEQGQGSKSLTLSMSIGWARAVLPAKIYLELNAMTDDLGTDLMPGFADRERRSFSGRPMSVEDPKPAFATFFHRGTDQLPPEAATRIAKLQGRVLVWIRASPEDIDLTIPGDPGGENGATVRICGADLKETSEVSLTLSKPSHQRGIFSCQLDVRNIDLRMLKDTARLWHLKDRKGQRYPGGPRSVRGGIKDEIQYGLEFNLPPEAEPASLAIMLPKRVVAIEIPFGLKDIPLK